MVVTFPAYREVLEEALEKRVGGGTVTSKRSRLNNKNWVNQRQAVQNLSGDKPEQLSGRACTSLEKKGPSMYAKKAPQEQERLSGEEFFRRRELCKSGPRGTDKGEKTLMLQRVPRVGAILESEVGKKLHENGKKGVESTIRDIRSKKKKKKEEVSRAQEECKTARVRRRSKKGRSAGKGRC